MKTTHHAFSLCCKIPGLLLVLALSILLSGCSLKETFWKLAGAVPGLVSTSSPAVHEVETVAKMTFNVVVPENTPEGEPILISILDEVTGLALNAQRYPMEPRPEGGYTIGLPFSPGSTIKYRYSRQAEILAEEHTTDGRPVRYRMVHVTAPGVIEDVVSRWNDTNFNGKTGRISGTAQNTQTGKPVPGLLVTAGGAQAITASDGSYLIEGLPPGTHQVVAYAQNGSYQTFQHGARVAIESTTPAPLDMVPAQKVDITFILHTPEETPPIVPIRLAGNLTQLGNTFADLSGGFSTLASRMPILSPLPDGTYGIILGLPVGAHIQYKYTLGDGFWNAERNAEGGVVLREMIVPDHPTKIEDTALTWKSAESAPITFDLIVPENTPGNETVSLQLNPYGWTESLPMWHLEGNRWAYVLYSPLDPIPELKYRFCRAEQCGIADDSRTPGPLSPGQTISPGKDPLSVSEEIPSWVWMENLASNPVDMENFPSSSPFGPDFITGIEFQDRYHPSWLPKVESTLSDLKADNANWVFLTPSWTFTRPSPPVLEPVTGNDLMWQETAEIIVLAQQQDFHVALHPVAHFPIPSYEWWQSVSLDFPWWVSWFDRYQAFAIHYAQLAERVGVETLILGGDWMSPALPNGVLADGTPSNIPEDANHRYRKLIKEIRKNFSGTIGWAFRYPDDLKTPPGFITNIDLIYALWSLPLSEDLNPDISTMKQTAEEALSTDLYASLLTLNMESKSKDIIIGISYPSVTGSTTGCLPDPLKECIPPESLDYPVPDYPLLDLDLSVQAKAYQAVLSSINKMNWIDGVVSRGYYLPAVLGDKSTSIHGKPAEEIVKAWYQVFTHGEP